MQITTYVTYAVCHSAALSCSQLLSFFSCHLIESQNALVSVVICFFCKPSGFGASLAASMSAVTFSQETTRNVCFVGCLLKYYLNVQRAYDADVHKVLT